LGVVGWLMFFFLLGYSQPAVPGSQPGWCPTGNFFKINNFFKENLFLHVLQ